MLLLSWSKSCFTAGATLTKTHLSENIQKSERFWPGPFEVSRFPFSLTPHTYTKSYTRHFEPSRFQFSSKLLSRKQTPTKTLLLEYKTFIRARQKSLTLYLNICRPKIMRIANDQEFNHGFYKQKTATFLLSSGIKFSNYSFNNKRSR